MAVDLENQEDRANLFTDLGKFQRQCLSNSVESDDQFNNRIKIWDKLIKIWDKSSDFLWEQGFWQDYLKCGEIALDCAAQLKKPDIEGRILNELGWGQLEQGNFDAAHQYFSESLQRFQQIHDPISQGQSWRYMGVLYFRRRYFGLALKCYRQALCTAQQALDQDSSNPRLIHQIAELHNLQGNLYLKLWNIQTCRRELLTSLKAFRRLGERYRYFQAAPLLNLGRVALLTRRYGKAKNYFERCYQLCKSINRPDTMAGVLLRLAELAQVQGNTEEANRLAKQAEEISGQEIPPLRNRAATFRAQIQGNHSHQQQTKSVLRKIRTIETLITNMLIHTPLVLIQSISYYTLFLGVKLTFEKFKNHLKD